MRLENESLFMSSLRSFFGFFFGTLGTLIALALGLILIVGIISLSDEDAFSSKVKLLPDAEGERKELGISSPVLLQIDLNGEIGKKNLTSNKIQGKLLKSREDEFKDGRLKGILLVINSPGGGVTDSDQIFRLIKNYKEKYHIPVYAFIDGLCASGGYYIACAADKIYASDVSLIGSIGVLAWPPFLNFYDAMEKLGINSMTLYAGEGKDKMNPLRPWKQDEQDMYQKLINFYYGRFLEIVSGNRSGIEKEKLEKFYGAGMFPASEALSIGLIDGSGYERSQVLKELAAAASIDEGQKYQVIRFKTKTPWWKTLFKSESSSPIVTGRMTHEWVLPQQLRMEPANPFRYLFTP